VTSSDHRKLFFRDMYRARVVETSRRHGAPHTLSLPTAGGRPGDLMREYYMQRNELLVTEGRRAIRP